MSERMGKEELKDWLSCVFESYRTHPGLTVEKDDMKQAYNQLVEIVEESKNWIDEDGEFLCLPEIIKAIQQNTDRVKVTPDHAVAKLIETLEWKFSDDYIDPEPDPKHYFMEVRISKNELKEIKELVEVLDD